MTLGRRERVLQPRGKNPFDFSELDFVPWCWEAPQLSGGKYCTALFYFQVAFQQDRSQCQPWVGAGHNKSSHRGTGLSEISSWCCCSASPLCPIRCSEQQKLPALNPVQCAVPLIPPLSPSCLHPSDIFRPFFPHAEVRRCHLVASFSGLRLPT